MELFTTPVSDFMSRALVSVGPRTSLRELQTILEERDVSAVPVLDRGGALVGIVSSTDLLRVSRVEIDRGRALSRVLPPPMTVGEIQRRDVVTVDADAPLRDAAHQMVAHRIHRVIVLREGRPVGVLSTRDAMRAFLVHRIETPLGEVLTTPVVTVDLGERVDVAVTRLAETNVRGLVVVDGDWPVGVFTHTEAIRARSLPREVLEETAVEDVMSYETLCLDVETPLHRVAGYAIQMRVRRVLAVHERRLRGILTGFDLVRKMTLDA
jgi:predicted transcriptional regulator